MEPTIVYRCPGSCQRPGGTFEWRAVTIQAEFDALVSAGFHTSLQGAVDAAEGAKVAKVALKVPLSVPEIPRKELELAAAKAGVKHPAKLSSSKLTQAIAQSDWPE